MASGKAQFDSGWLLFARLPRQIELSLESLGLPRDSHFTGTVLENIPTTNSRKAPDQMRQLISKLELESFWALLESVLDDENSSAIRISISK